MKKTTLTWLMATLVALQTAPSLAAYQIWEVDKDDGFHSGGSGFGNEIKLDVDGIEVLISGWSDTKGTTNYSDPNSEKIEEAALGYSGDSIHIVNQDESSGSPDHSIDSYNDYDYYRQYGSGYDWGDDFDAALLSFNTGVNLTHLGLGWARENYGESSEQNRSDVSILAYTGTNPFTGFDSAVDTWSNILTGNGGDWTVVGNYGNLAQYSYHAIPSSITSKYWLASVYNPVFNSNGGTPHYNDGFKLKGFKTHTPDGGGSVPLPGTTALLGLGLGLLLLRRRRIKA
ncbi:MAG: exosortase-dependent surface protein XDP1 [Pseudomonadota bacterium]